MLLEEQALSLCGYGGQEGSLMETGDQLLGSQVASARLITSFSEWLVPFFPPVAPDVTKLGLEQSDAPESPSVTSMAQVCLCVRHADHAFQPKQEAVKAAIIEEQKRGEKAMAEAVKRTREELVEYLREQRRVSPRSPCRPTQQYC